MKIEGGIHQLDKMVKGEELYSHSRLVAEEVALLYGLSAFSKAKWEKDDYHSLHKADKAPKCNSIILLNSVDGCKEVAHALHIAQITIVFVVSQKHILHLL